jgi:hypothetical protein
VLESSHMRAGISSFQGRMKAALGFQIRVKDQASHTLDHVTTRTVVCEDL